MDVRHGGCLHVSHQVCSVEPHVSHFSPIVKETTSRVLMLLLRKIPLCDCTVCVCVLCVCVCVLVQHRCATQAGGYVLDGRVNGSLNLSRAIGDMEYKQTSHLSAAEQAVTAFPDVRQIQLGSSSEFMILACDGIWDVLNNQQV